MPVSEPSRHWQHQKHQQIVHQDNPTAFAQLSELAFPHLVSFLEQEFHQVESHVCETAVIDCLLTYHAAPEKYDPTKLTLFAYLRMAARHDLLNALDRHNRRKRPLHSLDEPAVQAQLVSEITPESDPTDLADWLSSPNPSSRQEILRRFEADLDSTDRQLLLLMLNGVRDSESYAAVLQISALPLDEQRRQVKRAKDRLTKSLTRFARHQGIESE
ncbi:MAG: hypothetical protein IPM53_19110 [Anaerolineaceae bacterium]|nr:hypothetical protein [Anaerolineaceae bacterium]